MNKKGLTLIELLAVIAIMAIMFVILVPRISESSEKARETGIMSDFRAYQIAAKSYFMERSGTKDIKEFNKYLPTELKFEEDSTKANYKLSIKTNPYGKEHRLGAISKSVLNIYTQNPDTKKTYEMIINLEGDQIKMRTYGFAENMNQTGKGTHEGFVYLEFYNNEISIINYIGTATTVNIPNEIGGKKVKIIGRTGIGYTSGFGKKGITDITIGENVFFIGQQAFIENEIQTITLPSSMKSLGPNVFGANEIATVNLNEGLELLPESVFEQNKISSVNVPKTVERIERKAFTSNPNLTTYKINGKTEVDDDAFASETERQ